MIGLLWAQSVPGDEAGGVIALVRVIAGLGVGGVMAAAFFYLLFKQGDNYKEELRIVRAERRADLARMQRQIDRLYLLIDQTPPPGEDDDS
jgi:hypothetical protein